MKTLTNLMTAWLLLWGVHASAQQSVTLTYSNPAQNETAFVKTLLDFQQIATCDVVLSGKITGRRFIIEQVHSTDGVQTRKPIYSNCSGTDSLPISLMVQQIGCDSMRYTLSSQGFNYKGGATMAGVNNCILLETIPGTELSTANSIPIMAYCAGERICFETADGGEIEGLSYCNIRRANLHPSKWHERFNMADYIYFELKFTDTPSNGTE